MLILYPLALVGFDKTKISVNVVLDALKSVEVWRGGTGDESKEHLMVAMAQAMRAHKKYCKDHVPSGWLRDHALKSGQYTHQFWLSLVLYIKDKTILLQTFKLPEKSICLIMLHQLIQMCNNISEFQTNMRNAGFDSPEAGAWYSWVGLQALQCMDGYLQAKFKLHQGINLMFMRFLTRTMANQLAMGIKSNVNKLEKQVKALADKADNLATKKSYHDLDAKLDAVISANNLKKRQADAQRPWRDGWLTTG
jgi:hypothetical protein